MAKTVIFGNSGSGKSTLAKQLADENRDGANGAVAHLDLDTIAWLPSSPPTRMPLSQSTKLINAFLDSNNNWVIEGCYADLLALVMPNADEVIFLNLPVEKCIENAKGRPWEPHKYESLEAQNANLAMLLDWILQYEERSDTFSKQAHETLYNGFEGQKVMHVSNQTFIQE